MNRLRTLAAAWLLCVLALAGLLGGVLAAPALAQDSPFGAICTVHGGPPGEAPPPGQHHHDCALCPACAAIAVSFAMQSAPPRLPPPRAILARRAPRADQPRAPPQRRALIPPPRGPPAFA